MITFIPYQKFEIKTRLGQEATRQKLMEIVGPRKLRWGLAHNHLPFEGKVEVDTFQFSRVTNSRKSFLPILEGKIQNDLDATKLVIKAHLHLLVLILWPNIWFYVLGLIYLMAGWKSLWLIVPLAVFSLTAPTISFHWELDKAKKILNEQLETDKYSLP